MIVEKYRDIEIHKTVMQTMPQRENPYPQVISEKYGVKVYNADLSAKSLDELRQKIDHELDGP